jgi:hypothetical protein
MRVSAYFGEETAGTEEGDEVPIAEPLCELEAAALGVAATAALPTRRHVRCAEFVERMHHLFDRLFFEPWSILDRKIMRTEDWRWVLWKTVRDLFFFRSHARKQKGAPSVKEGRRLGSWTHIDE